VRAALALLVSLALGACGGQIGTIDLELTSAPQRLGDSWRMTVSAPAR